MPINKKIKQGDKMNRKTLIISILLMLTLVLSACGAVGTAPAATRSMTVNGVGQVSLNPDIAYIYIGVRTDAESAAEAVAQNNTKTEQLIAALKAAGIADADLRTSNFSIWSNMLYSPDGQPTGKTSYQVENTVYVTVRDLTKLGDILDQAVKSGANNINSIQFDVADKTEAMAKARQAAVEAAKKQAGELATAAGVSLGGIQSISYFDSTPGPVYDMAKGMGGGGAEAVQASVPITPGTMQISVNVTLTYEIK